MTTAISDSNASASVAAVCRRIQPQENQDHREVAVPGQEVRGCNSLGADRIGYRERAGGHPGSTRRGGGNPCGTNTNAAFKEIATLGRHAVATEESESPF
jgi:hypothetical protein